MQIDSYERETLSTGKKGTGPRPKARDELPAWFELIRSALIAGKLKIPEHGKISLLFGDEPAFLQGSYSPGEAKKFRATKAEIEEFLRDERKDAQSSYRKLLSLLSTRRGQIDVVIGEHRQDHMKRGEPSTRTWRTLTLELSGAKSEPSHT